MRIVVLAGGVGGARFLRGLRHAAPQADITVIGNTGDDITLFGLRVCPDLDTVMYTLGGGIDEEQGWGRTAETFAVQEDLAAYGAQPQWFGLGDRDFATHIRRSQLLAEGQPLSAVTATLCARWQLDVRLLPMTDDPVETHVVIADPEAESGRRAVHFQEYWVRMHAEPEALGLVPVGAEHAAPAPGVREAVESCDVVLLPPSNPVVSIGTILAVPGIRPAIAEAGVPVVGLSPVIGGRPLRGMADKVLAAVGATSTAAGVAEFYGPGLLDGWLVDETDKDAVEQVEAAGIRCHAVPLVMRDVPAAGRMAADALALAEEIG
ncbi:MAG: 2-phospho-L-lactate transferase [Streptosporangiales bacterium]|nr:2-phospho-L-lactate transferase [Streptosporangiales bacterium]